MHAAKVLIDDSKNVTQEMVKALKYGMRSPEQMQIVIDNHEIWANLHLYTIAGSHSTAALKELNHEGKNLPMHRACYVYLASDLSDANILRIGSADNASQQRTAAYKPFECSERLLRLFRGHWESACEVHQVPLEYTDPKEVDLAYKTFTSACEESMEDDLRAKGIGRIATELKMAPAPKRVWDKIIKLVCVLKGVPLEEEPGPAAVPPVVTGVTSLLEVELKKHERTTTKKEKKTKKKKEGEKEQEEPPVVFDKSSITIPRTWFKSLGGLPYR